ncbi:MAG: hypothetical protein EOM26_12515 [Alphaproteobacteria bacterium]|nr:hypothetical protein [Alphaproteobacteria bacterium]
MLPENTAPDIFRQRLLIEGYWTVDVDGETVKQFLLDLAAELGLRTYGTPIVFSPGSGMGSGENAGFDAFVPLIDSGISGYFWSSQKFLSVVLYTCKGFEAEKAVAFTKEYFQLDGKVVSFSF